jgi:hypothetical protein
MEKHPSGAKAPIFMKLFTARLKPCPFKAHVRLSEMVPFITHVTILGDGAFQDLVTIWEVE